MENFFDRLKVEMFYGRTYTSISNFIEELHSYLDYHNNRRISLKLKRNGSNTISKSFLSMLII
ncbi:IS3 family transposase [Chryseobacterium sp.]|uniref:IS3 family transposase n=1 Tax=Chryseobacterium sp. TaxID=1871047 RepID=UPI003FA53B92